MHFFLAFFLAKLLLFCITIFRVISASSNQTNNT
jgi:hypothetical protein